MSKFKRRLKIINNMTGYKSATLEAASTQFENSLSHLDRAKKLGDLSLKDKGALVERINANYKKVQDSLVNELAAIESSEEANQAAINSKLLLNTQQQQLIGLLSDKTPEQIMRLAKNDPSIAVMAAAGGALLGLGTKDSKDLIKTIAPENVANLDYLAKVKEELGSAAKTLTGNDRQAVDLAQLSAAEEEQLQILTQSAL